jgi:hypothetical protein
LGYEKLGASATQKEVKKLIIIKKNGIENSGEKIQLNKNFPI